MFTREKEEENSSFFFLNISAQKSVPEKKTMRKKNKQKGYLSRNVHLQTNRLPKNKKNISNRKHKKKD